jgi:pyruvate formate lyase activating enzyme
MTLSKMKKTASELAGAVDKWTSCICYFGGDPTPQLPHALRDSRIALENNPKDPVDKGRILRICWETNGSMHPSYLDRMMDLSIGSGGCVKFDLKTWDERLNIALCGVTNKRTLENFKRASKRIKERPEPPPLIASTLLIPGYIDEEEVSVIARFIASLNPDIPYALLAFHPQFFMTDIPVTSRDQAYRCLDAARSGGLTRVRLGNIHLLA